MPAGGARPGAGRPKLPASKLSDVKVWTSVTKAEERRLRARAKKKRMKLVDWVRWKLLR
jgi:hypothetical protein